MADAAPNYPPGTPIWVDLGSPDLEASRAFYSRLFGWQAENLGPEMGEYTLFRVDGKMVAAAGPLMSPQQPPAWSMYVSTTDATATARAVQEAGGSVIMEPMDVMEQGRMAVCQDPTGAFFSIWQPGVHRGAELVNAPGAFTWNELATRDMDAAKVFYKKVFGWDSVTNSMGEGAGDYTEWKLNDRDIGGGMVMGEQFPPQVPPHWLTYFSVADCDATTTSAQELGGSVRVPPMTIPQGRFSVLADPQGAVFGVIAVAGAANG